jgi:hypothetical protein
VNGKITLAAFMHWWHEQFIGEADAQKELEERLAAPPVEIEGLVQTMLPKVHSLPFVARFVVITCVLYAAWVIFCISTRFSHPLFWGIMFGVALISAILLTAVHIPKSYEVLEDGLVLHTMLSCARLDLPFHLMAGPESVRQLTPLETVEDAWCVCLVLAPENTVQVSYKGAAGQVRTVECYPETPDQFVALLHRQLADVRGAPPGVT